jgi:hypothetical protein
MRNTRARALMNMIAMTSAPAPAMSADRIAIAITAPAVTKYGALF